MNTVLTALRKTAGILVSVMKNVPFVSFIFQTLHLRTNIFKYLQKRFLGGLPVLIILFLLKNLVLIHFCYAVLPGQMILYKTFALNH